MRCSQARNNLSPYIDGELEADEITRLEEHLAQCDRCRGKLDEIRRLHGLFMQADEALPPYSMGGAYLAMTEERQ